MRSIGAHREDPPAEGVGAADDVSTAVHPGEGDPAAVRRPDRIEFVQRRFLPRDPPAVGANDVDVPRCVVVAVLDAERNRRAPAVSPRRAAKEIAATAARNASVDTAPSSHNRLLPRTHRSIRPSWQAGNAALSATHFVAAAISVSARASECPASKRPRRESNRRSRLLGVIPERWRRRVLVVDHRLVVLRLWWE